MNYIFITLSILLLSACTKVHDHDSNVHLQPINSNQIKSNKTLSINQTKKIESDNPTSPVKSNIYILQGASIEPKMIQVDNSFLKGIKLSNKFDVKDVVSKNSKKHFFHVDENKNNKYNYIDASNGKLSAAEMIKKQRASRIYQPKNARGTPTMFIPLIKTPG